MKKLITIMALSVTTSAFAGYGAAGCGLGSIVLGDSKGFTQVFASTTNGTSGSQTFGISSGTSNCGSSGKTPTQFIEVNKSALSNEAARGEGETIMALSEIYGCKDSNTFGKILKSDFEAIFKNNNPKNIDLNIKSTLKSNKITCDLV